MIDQNPNQNKTPGLLADATPHSDLAELRRRAEKKERVLEPQDMETLSPEETRQTLHKLRVHQIELEMQNEDLRRAHAELDAARARYFDLYDLAPVGYFTVNEKGLILETNLTAATMLGVTRAALVKQPLTRFILPKDQDIFYRHRKQLFETGTPQASELRMQRHDGTQIWVLMETTVGRDKESSGLVGRCAMSDITEHKQEEEELTRLNQQNELILGSAAEGILGLDLQGNHTFVNTAAARMLGYEAEELLGRPSHSAWHHTKLDGCPYPREECMIYAAYLDRAVRRSSTEVFWRKDGTCFPVEYASTPIYEQGRLAGAVVTFSDIADRKRADEEKAKLQAQFVQAQKMESVGRLAGGVAHDFNNMLSVILGYTQLALDKMDPSEPLYDDLQAVLTAAKRSTEITRQLLAFARKQTIAPKVLNLNETVEGMLKMLRRLIGEDIDLVWLPKAGLWPVMMDPSQLDQILANLCVNARDAIGGVGKLTIEMDKVAFDEAYCADHAGFVPGEFALLAVSDDGSGMDKETLKQIFEPFFTTKGIGHGTGLGLSTVYGIVKQNNGFVNVYSEPGKGTTFKIYLPRHAGQAVEIRTVIPAEIPKGHGETLLIVEDEPSLLKMIETMLQRLGYTTLTANTTDKAIRLAEEHAGEIQLLITDVVMPEMNGRELAERLQAFSPKLKCLFMSGYTANAIAHRGVLNEGVNFIQKPFSKMDLAVKVRAAIDRK